MPSENTTSPRTLRELWEAKPLLIKRHNTKYNVGWFSSEEFSNIIRDVGNTTVKVACSSLLCMLYGFSFSFFDFRQQYWKV